MISSSRRRNNKWDNPVSDNLKLTERDKNSLKAEIRKNPTNLKLLAARYGVDFSYVVSLHKEIQRSLAAHSIDSTKATINRR